MDPNIFNSHKKRIQLVDNRLCCQFEFQQKILIQQVPAIMRRY